MSENNTSEPFEEKPANENFAQMVETYNAPNQAEVRMGDKIRSQIISIGADTVFVNTGTKIDGVVEKKEMLDESGNFPYKEGDSLDLYVVKVSENEIRLSKGLSGAGDADMVRDAFSNKVPIEGKVKEQCKGGFVVEVMQQRAFCPVSQIDIKYVEKPEEYVGNSYQFMVTRFENNGKNIVISRRELLAREQKGLKRDFMETLTAGAVLPGKVKNVMPYGAFVELYPGVEGMVHVSELSWSRVEKTEEAIKTGDEITVKILSVEKGEKNQLKISLSVKQVGGDPWECGDTSFCAGAKISGKVTRCTDFGAFVEIAPGIEGLVHVSEMSYLKRIAKPEDLVKPGDIIEVMVKEADMQKKRISLSMRDAEGDPWVDIKQKYPAGAAVTGTLEKKEKFGYFITLEPGITGLLPKSKIGRSEKASMLEKLKLGDSLTVNIDDVKIKERKISLGIGEDKSEEDWRKYTKPAVQESSPMGILAEKLQQAMQAKQK